jgi:hypothetical protein
MKIKGFWNKQVEGKKEICQGKDIKMDGGFI